MELLGVPRRNFSFLLKWRTDAREPAPPDVILTFHPFILWTPCVAVFLVPFTWIAAGSFLAMNTLGIIGSEIANHRYFSHRSFKTSRWFEAFLGLCSGLVLQDSAFQWATDHRSHHRYSDAEGENRDRDPHNSRRGFSHSFYTWLLTDNPHRNDMEAKRKLGKDLRDNKLLNTVQYYPLVFAILASILFGLYEVGGVSAEVWGLFGLVVVPYLDMLLVNSVGHGHGPDFLHDRPFETKDRSRNVALLASIGSGVGWHNNHHAFPSSARCGFRWWQIDKAWILIRLFEMLGLVWDVQAPKKEQIERRLSGPT